MAQKNAVPITLQAKLNRYNRRASDDRDGSLPPNDPTSPSVTSPNETTIRGTATDSNNGLVAYQVWGGADQGSATLRDTLQPGVDFSAGGQLSHDLTVASGGGVSGYVGFVAVHAGGGSNSAMVGGSATTQVAAQKLATPTLSPNGSPTSSSIPLAWTYPDGEGQGGFEVRRSLAGQNNWTISNTFGAAARSGSATGLTAEQSYDTQIRATHPTDSNLNSDWSNTVTDTTAVASFSPTFQGNFDSGTLGDPPTGPDGYSGGNARGNGGREAIYSNTRSYSGSQSAEIRTVAGSVWFGINNMPIPGGNLREGDEIWMQMKFYIPSSWDWTGGQPVVKWINLAPNVETDRVYWSINATEWQLIAEGQQKSYTILSGSIPRDQWVTVEIWCKCTSADEVSMRLWQDHVFKGEKQTPTIDPGLELDEIRLGDYWNNTAPADQECWVDDLIIYNSRAGDIPSNTDAGGRTFIGNVG